MPSNDADPAWDDRLLPLLTDQWQTAEALASRAGGPHHTVLARLKGMLRRNLVERRIVKTRPNRTPGGRCSRPNSAASSSRSAVADWAAIEHKTGVSAKHGFQSAEYERFHADRVRQAAGYGSFPVIGDPDAVANELARINALGFTCLAVGLVNDLDEFPTCASRHSREVPHIFTPG